MADNSGGPAHDPPETVAEVGEFGLIGRVTAGRGQPATTLLGPGDDAAHRGRGGRSGGREHRRPRRGRPLQTGLVHAGTGWAQGDRGQPGRHRRDGRGADRAARRARLPAHDQASEWSTGPRRRHVAGGDPAGAGVVGGDVVTANELVISVTALGDLQGREPSHPGRRLPRRRGRGVRPARLVGRRARRAGPGFPLAGAAWSARTGCRSRRTRRARRRPTPARRR